MDFAPYQSSPPEHTRSPSNSTNAGSPRTSLDNTRRSAFSPSNYQHRPPAKSPPPLQHPQPQRAWSGDNVGRYQSPLASNVWTSGDSYQNDTGAGNGGSGMGDYFSSLGAREGMISEFDTSLGLRLDYEACLAYLAFPPIGGILLLILERKSDYVRFHAWQSSLLFTGLFVLHLLFSWSSFLSWVMFLGDLVLIGWLALNAYRDADTLDRYEVPIVGRIASRILDDE
ncbi:hypothetical protein QBC40DRAFT_348676 [Triangularia verruculosa]|uniref:Uncharacterized protein n=1 Tax=Triangularia verruculosa TaxID=2587418 RepID=A0AAN7ATA9_9PEZI|nr:hypothetical protein QBC40DRAFT_348676 [Triangularia verruculosa]